MTYLVFLWIPFRFGERSTSVTDPLVTIVAGLTNPVSKLRLVAESTKTEIDMFELPLLTSLSFNCFFKMYQILTKLSKNNKNRLHISDFAR